MSATPGDCIHLTVDIVKEIHGKTAVLQTDLPDEPEVANRLTSYFPAALTIRHASALALHPLRRLASFARRMLKKDGDARG